MKVSRNPTRDHLSKPKTQEVGLAIISTNEYGMLFCSCGGFSALDKRKKVREDRAERHINKKHDGRGIWL